MIYRNKKINWTCLSILIIYMIIVFSMTLVPYNGEYTYEKNFNLIPFESIKNYYQSIQYNGFFSGGTPSMVAFINLFGNIGLLLPYGFLLPLSFPGRITFKKTVLSAFLMTTFIEMTQFLFLVSRRADIDDVIFNTLSAIIGYILYFIFCHGHYKHYKRYKPDGKTYFPKKS